VLNKCLPPRMGCQAYMDVYTVSYLIRISPPFKTGGALWVISNHFHLFSIFIVTDIIINIRYEVFY